MYNKSKTKFTQLIVLCLIILLTSCGQEGVKPDAISNNGTADKVKRQKLTNADREKYRAGITALNNNELPKARRIFNEFIRSKPQLAGGYSNLALVHFKKHENESSLKLVNKALQLNPKQAQALNLRAQIYISNGKIHKAKDDYIAAINAKPKYANAQYNLALLYDIYFQEIPLAIKHYKIYISLLKKPDEKTLEWIKHLEGTLKDA